MENGFGLTGIGYNKPKVKRPRPSSAFARPSQPNRPASRSSTRRVRPSTASRARPSVRRSYSRASNNAAQNVQQHSPVRRRRRRGNNSGTGRIRPQRSSSRHSSSNNNNQHQFHMSPPPSLPSAPAPFSFEQPQPTTKTKKILQPSMDLMNRLAGYGLDAFYTERPQSAAPTTSFQPSSQSQSQLQPQSSQSTPVTATTATTTTIPQLQNNPTTHELQEALRVWLHEVDQTSFQSFAVFCEYKLRRSASQSAQWSTPNAFGTSVAWICLMRAAESLPNYRGLFEALAETIGPSIYCEYTDVVTHLMGDGGEEDAWTLFQADTFFERSRCMEKDIFHLRNVVEELLLSSKELKNKLTENSMFSALGLVSESLRAASNRSVTLLARQKQRQEGKKQRIVTPEEEEEEDQNNVNNVTLKEQTEQISDIESAMRSLLTMKNEELHCFVTDLASHRNGFVSVGILSDLFGIAPPSSRNSFLSILWRLLHHTEKGVLLKTIPIRSRDEELRERLEAILLNSGLTPPLKPTQQLYKKEHEQDQNNNNQMSDSTIVSFVEHACKAATVAGESQNREFLHRMMCALEMLNVGEQNVDPASIVLPSDPQSAIESRARETARLWHVEREKSEQLTDQLEEIKTELIETKASVRTMVRVQARLNEYDASSSEIRSDDKGVSMVVDSSIGGGSGGSMEWPILHHTNKPRQHSLHRLIDSFFEEETLRNGGHLDPASTGKGGSQFSANKEANNMSLEELHSYISSFYNCALLSTGPKSYSMAQMMKLHLLCEYGDPHMAIEHCRRIDIALRHFYKMDPRCHLFAMICGSVETNSFLNRPETSQFIATTLAHMMKAEVVEDIACVQDLFELTSENCTKSFRCEQAEIVVRRLFRLKEDNEPALENVSCMIGIFWYFFK